LLELRNVKITKVKPVAAVMLNLYKAAINAIKKKITQIIFEAVFFHFTKSDLFNLIVYLYDSLKILNLLFKFE